MREMHLLLKNITWIEIMLNWLLGINITVGIIFCLCHLGICLCLRKEYKEMRNPTAFGAIPFAWMMYACIPNLVSFFFAPIQTIVLGFIWMVLAPFIITTGTKFK